VTVRIRDLGKGIPVNKIAMKSVLGVGISGMKKRVKLNGELRISKAEPGTLVEAMIPIVHNPMNPPSLRYPAWLLEKEPR
jgi:signal transduction histidine kinase